MIEVEITEEMRITAHKESEKLGELKNSVTRGAGNLIGFLGEMAALKVLEGRIESTADYDLVTEDGTKYDVKSKKCYDTPLPHFDCTVMAFNIAQKCDRYIFVRVKKDLTKAWVVGELPKAEFFKKAIFVQQGQYNPANKWRCTADCYNVQINELNPPTLPKKKEQEKPKCERCGDTGVLMGYHGEMCPPEFHPPTRCHHCQKAE